MAEKSKSALSEEPKDNPTEVLGMTAIKPVQRTGWDCFSHFLYNPATGAICSRTPKSWGLIALFYIIFYGFLISFWLGMFKVFNFTIKEDRPKYLLNNSLIGQNPGLGFRPRQGKGSLQSTLIRLRKGWTGVEVDYNETTIEESTNIGYALRMKEFLDSMSPSNDSIECMDDDINIPRPLNARPCKLDVTDVFAECAEWPYGYSDQDLSPCIIIKVNRIFGFVPEPLSPEVIKMDEDRYESLPEKLRARINEGPPAVFIDCQGESSQDRELINPEKIKYFPSDQSISLGYFPYQSKDNKVNPSVAVKFPDLPNDQIVHVLCKLWYKGVVHSKVDLSGMVRFDLLIEDQMPTDV